MEKVALGFIGWTVFAGVICLIQIGFLILGSCHD